MSGADKSGPVHTSAQTPSDRLPGARCPQVRAIAPADDDRPSDQKGRDTVTDAMDAYMSNGVEAVAAWCGANPLLEAAYMQGAAAIHAAEIEAEAMDRQTAALTELSKGIGRLIASTRNF